MLAAVARCHHDAVEQPIEDELTPERARHFGRVEHRARQA